MFITPDGFNASQKVRSLLNICFLEAKRCIASSWNSDTPCTTSQWLKGMTFYMVLEKISNTAKNRLDKFWKIWDIFYIFLERNDMDGLMTSWIEFFFLCVWIQFLFLSWWWNVYSWTDISKPKILFTNRPMCIGVFEYNYHILILFCLYCNLCFFFVLLFLFLHTYVPCVSFVVLYKKKMRKPSINSWYK